MDKMSLRNQKFSSAQSVNVIAGILLMTFCLKTISSTISGNILKPTRIKYLIKRGRVYMIL